MQMLNAWLHFTNNTFPPPTSIEEILDQPLFLNPHTINYPTIQIIHIFIVYHPKIFLTSFALFADCRFADFSNLDLLPLQLLEKKLNLPNVNHNKIYKSIIDLILNNWLHALKTETSQQSLFKVFYFNYKGTKMVKNLQKLSNKEIYFSLQNNNENFNRPFKFISWTNYIDGNPALAPGD